MKVFELIEALKSYPPNAPVVAEWDQGWSNLNKHSLDYSVDDEGKPEEQVVVFNVSIYNTYEYPEQEI